MAPGMVMVISTIGIPLLATASAANLASSVEDVRTAGTIPTSRILVQISSLCIDGSQSARLENTANGRRKVLFSGPRSSAMCTGTNSLRYNLLGRFCAIPWECYAAASDPEAARVLKEERLLVFGPYD